MNTDVTSQVLRALLTATDEQKEHALRVLRGEPLTSTPAVEPYLELKEIGEKLNIHPGTLCKWRVPKHDLAGRPRYIMSEVRAYLESPEFKSLATDLRTVRRDKRKEQLLALAAEGNEEAVADLFKEFGIDVKPGEKGGAS